MRYQKTVNVKDLLETSSITDIMRKGIFLNNLNQQLQTLFPAQFKGLFRLVNFTSDSLNIEVTSAVVRQGFLFRQQALLQIVQKDYPEILKLNFKVNPELGRAR